MFQLSYMLIIAIIRATTSLLVDILLYFLRRSMRLLSFVAKLVRWLVDWRNKNIEALVLRNKLKSANTFSEWAKAAKAYDKLKGIYS